MCTIDFTSKSVAWCFQHDMAKKNLKSRLGAGLVRAWCGLGVGLVRAWCELSEGLVWAQCRGSVGKFFIQKSLLTLFDSMGPVVGSLEFHISHRIDLVVGLQWDSSMYILPCSQFCSHSWYTTILYQYITSVETLGKRRKSIQSTSYSTKKVKIVQKEK